MKLTKEIDPEWSDYYKTFAYEMLNRYGIICLDFNNLPVDNMEEISRVADCINHKYYMTEI